LENDRRRNLSKEDLVLWDQVKKTFDQTLKHPEMNHVYQGQEKKEKVFEGREKREKAVLAIDKLAFDHKKYGEADRISKIPLNHNLDKKKNSLLKKGKIRPEKILDLHGLNAKLAEKEVLNFIEYSYSNGIRLILIITGKGKRSQNKDRLFQVDRDVGILKEALIPWIKNSKMWTKILKIMPAHQKHGGGGAFYVYLRKIK